MNDSLNCGLRNAECGMDAPTARMILPRVGSQLLYTLTAANARIAMGDSCFGRPLREGDVRPLIVTHESAVHGDGEAVTVSGEVLTGRGVMMPVDGVPLVRSASPGAAHWPVLDGGLVLTLEERADPCNDAPASDGGEALDAMTLRSMLEAQRRHARNLSDELERKREHETSLIKWRDNALVRMEEERRMMEAVTKERDTARQSLEVLRGIGAEADALRLMLAKAEAALREVVDERDALKSLNSTLASDAAVLRADKSLIEGQMQRAASMIKGAREALGSVVF